MADAMEENKLPHLRGSVLDRLADLLSYVLHPVVLMILTVVLVSFWTRRNLAQVGLDVGILIIGLLPGLLYIYIKTRQGQFSHYHLILKEERRVALPLLFLGMLISFGLYAFIGAPLIMMRGMAIGLVAGLGAIVISRFWKISLHAAVAMGCAGLFIALSWQAASCFALLGLLVGLARIRIRHHTPAQVLVGWIYGFCTGSLSIFWLKDLIPY